jgi:RimJ/RimL family protein N-acetyltransferase
VIDRSNLGCVAETDRIVIRPWRVDEVDRFVEIYRRPEVVRWFPAAPMLERSEAVDRIERSLVPLAAGPGFGRWAVVERLRGIPVGTVILQPLPDGDGEVEIGWHLHPDSWGKGLASEAAGALLARAFADGVEEVWAVMHLDNHRSAAVAKRIGMRLLGITHRWYHEPSLMFWAGARHDQKPSLAPDERLPPRNAEQSRFCSET